MDIPNAVALVVGSGIAAQQLSPSDIGLQLLENAAATAVGPPAAPQAPESSPNP